jgi:hypothetical protein
LEEPGIGFNPVIDLAAAPKVNIYANDMLSGLCQAKNFTLIAFDADVNP